MQQTCLPVQTSYRSKATKMVFHNAEECTGKFWKASKNKLLFSLIPADFHLDLQRCQKDQNLPYKVTNTDPLTRTALLPQFHASSTLLLRSLWKMHFNNYFVWEKRMEGFSITLFSGILILSGLFYLLEFNYLQFLSFVKHLGWL